MARTCQTQIPPVDFDILFTIGQRKHFQSQLANSRSIITIHSSEIIKSYRKKTTAPKTQEPARSLNLERTIEMPFISGKLLQKMHWRYEQRSSCLRFAYHAYPYCKLISLLNLGRNFNNNFIILVLKSA